MPGYEPVGREFESPGARHKQKRQDLLLSFLFISPLGVDSTLIQKRNAFLNRVRKSAESRRQLASVRLGVTRCLWQRISYTVQRTVGARMMFALIQIATTTSVGFSFYCVPRRFELYQGFALNGVRTQGKGRCNRGSPNRSLVGLGVPVCLLA